MSEMLVFCHFNDAAAQDVRCLMRYAYELSCTQQMQLDAVYAGAALADEDAQMLAACGAQQIHFLQTDACIGTDGALAREAATLIRSISPQIVLFSATNETRILAAQIAALLETGLTADCSELCFADGLLLQTRPAFGGNLFASIVCPKSRPQMATVHPFAFAPLPPLAEKHAQIVLHKSKIQNAIRLIDEKRNESSRLCDADVVLCGGNGLDAEDFALLARICEKTGAAMGATRAAVNDARAPYRYQIGQTGAGLRAKLYVGFGVSGAVQHLAGMKNCQTIIAVNTDKKAPIASCCDVFVHADAKHVLKVLAAALCLEK